MELRNLLYTTLTQILIALTAFTSGAQISTTKPLYRSKAEPTVRIKCLTGVMLVTIKDAPVSHESGSFSGMIYPKGLSKNSTCLSEYRDHTGALKYKLPLRSCNTMPQETEDGGIEFFNTIVLQPHLKLVTDMGRGYHVRCRYKSRESAAADASALSSRRKLSPQPYKSGDVNDEQQQHHQEDASDRRDYGRSLGKFNDEDADHAAVDANAIASYDISDDVPMPGCHMKIFNEDEKIAENVKIGDALTLVINIDKQDIYGLHVTDCIVRDGLGWGEQKLVGEYGCPMDNEIMGPFVYNNDRLSANVTFPAHKFPYTASVYYQCNVRLCALQDPDCQKAPSCGDNVKRPKRQSSSGVKDDDGLPATIEVYSGLYVNENNDSSESDDDSVFRERTEDAICVSQRTFAIAIAIAGLILMLAVVAAVLCIMARRRTKTVSHSGSSIYSGPYTNTAFSHSS